VLVPSPKLTVMCGASHLAPGHGGRVTLLVGACQHDGVVQHAWALQRDVRSKRFAKTGVEQLDLVCFHDGDVVIGQSHELLGEVIDEAVAAKKSQFANGALRQRRPEAFVDELHEAWPQRRTGVELQPVILQLSIVGEVE
jgi:hypothetical protein